MDILETAVEEIPKGGHPRTLLGVPTGLTMACMVLGIGPILAYGAWIPLLVLVPVWLWLRFQCKRDPHCLQVWAGHLGLTQHYEA